MAVIPIRFRSILIERLQLFCSDAGNQEGPTQLLHGLPSSSKMFEPLMKRRVDISHLFAPDSPEFGHSSWPDAQEFGSTFDSIVKVITRLAVELAHRRYTTHHMENYGGPVDFRLTLEHPERIDGLIAQDAVAHDERLELNWEAQQTSWTARAENESAFREKLISLAVSRARHVGGDPKIERYDPDLWTDEFRFLDQPGQADIQCKSFHDDQTNMQCYSKWQTLLRVKTPCLMVIWGNNDRSFFASKQHDCLRDLPETQAHTVDCGHSVPATCGDRIASMRRYQ